MQETGTNQPRFWWNETNSQHKVTGDQEEEAAGGEMFHLHLHITTAAKAVLISSDIPSGYFAQAGKLAIGW